MKRSVAISASASMVVGALMPFLFTHDAANAAVCTTQTSAYTIANGNVKVAYHQVQVAKKKLKRAKKHHASKHFISKKKHRLAKKRAKLAAARYSRTFFASQLVACTKTANGGGSTTTQKTQPQVTVTANPTGTATATSTATATTTATSTATTTATATSTATTTATTTTTALPNPVDALNQLLQALESAGLSASTLTDALNQIADEIRTDGAGVPGSDALASVIDQLASAIAAGATQIDPSQLQAILAQLPSSIDPAKFQAALEAAAAALQSSLTNPPTTPSGLIDAIITPLATGLDTAGVPALPGLLTDVQNGLDQLVGGLLGALTGRVPGL